MEQIEWFESNSRLTRWHTPHPENDRLYACGRGRSEEVQVFPHAHMEAARHVYYLYYCHWCCVGIGDRSLCWVP